MNPSDDLVSRLRAHGPKRSDARALMNEAAAEIERLRADRSDKQFACVVAYESENRMLRDILKESRSLADVVYGENRPAREWALEIRASIDAALNPSATHHAG